MLHKTTFYIFFIHLVKNWHYYLEVKNLKGKNTFNKKIMTPVLLSVLAASYFIPVWMYSGKFMVNTYINGIDVSNKSFTEAEKILDKAFIDDYVFVVKERNEKNESIKGDDSWLSADYDMDNLIGEQNYFQWPVYFIKNHEYAIDPEMKIDEENLIEQIRSLECMDDAVMEPPVDAYISQYEKGSGYRIIDDIKGTKLNKDDAVNLMLDNIKLGGRSINLETCYVPAKITAESETLNEMVNKLNKVAGSKVNYQFGDEIITLDSDTYYEWIVTDETGNITIDRERALDYVTELAEETDTAYTQREFTTTDKRIVNVTGPYGYRMAKEDETTKLCEDLLTGQTIDRKPVYTREGVTRENHDYGGTYVEIDLTNQKVYLYVNGSLIKSSSCVTGNVSKGHTTPPGIYPMTYKQLDAVLRGPGYASPVKYWMPFNGGIGLHDASWRANFGGTIYKTNGSHGCVNLPYEMAKTIYENAYAGMPVICYN